MKRVRPEAILLLLIAVAVAVGAVALTATPEPPVGGSPPVLGDYERLTLRVEGMT